MPERWRDRSADESVPHSRGTILTRGDDARTVGAERDARHGALMPEWRGQQIAASGGPYSRCLVVTRGDDPGTVRGESNVIHSPLMLEGWGQRPARDCLPSPSLRVP